MAKLLKDISEVPERPRPAAKGLTPGAEAGLKITGWLLVVIGIAVLAFVVFDQLSDRPGSLFPDYSLDTNSRSTSGTVDQVEPKAGKGSKYQKIHFHYGTEAGATQKGFSYAVRPPVSQGSTVDIEYHPSDPSLSRIKNTYAARIPIHMFIGFSSILIIGAPLLFMGYRLSGIRMRILRDGEIAEATIKDVTVDKRRGRAPHHPSVVTFEFNDFTGMPFCNKGDLWNDPADTDRNPPQPGGKCLIAYDRENPSRNMLLSNESFQKSS
jgi:hypothetical protein